MEPWASCWDQNKSSVDVTMSADKKTAYRTGTTVNGYVTAISTKSGLYNVYVEVTPTFTGDCYIGISNANINTALPPGSTVNSIAMWSPGSVFYNNVQIGQESIGYNSGDTVAVAVWGQLQLVQWRNVTQNSAWSNLYSLAPIGQAPFYLVVGLNNVVNTNSAYANFYGPFQGALPTIGITSNVPSTFGNPPFTVWNPEALYSEQPVKVIDFDAVLTDGTYTSDSLNDLTPIPFSYIKWGDAVLDAQYNLSFTDWVIDDRPIFSIVLGVDGPVNNWFWAAWDYQAPFPFVKVHVPAGTTSVAVSNIPIPPPPASTNPPLVGQGHVLQIFSSCDTSVAFSWSQGRVYGTEDTLVWGPVEYATYPPSITGRLGTIVVDNPIFSATMSNGTMTTTGDTTGASSVKMPISAITLVGKTNATLAVPPAGAAGDIYFNNTPTGPLLLSVALAATQGSYNITVYYSWDGGDPGIPIPVSSISVQPTDARSPLVNLQITDLTIPVPAGAHNLVLYIDGSVAGNTINWSNAVLIETSTASPFPAYTPLFPPPLVGQGGGAPPTFPPPTPPPIGAIPAGILVGPAIAAAAVPPSVAGIAQPVFTYGSATTPPASAAFPEFTTTFPVPPVAFSNIFTDGTSPTTPPHSISTPPLGGSYNTGGAWGPPIGPALPAVVPPRQFMAEVSADEMAALDEPSTAGPDFEPEPEPEDEPPHRRRGRGRRR